MRLIDADVLLDKAIEQYCKDCDKRKGIKSGKWRVVYEIGDAPCRACGVGDVIDEIEEAPTIDPVRKGKWMTSYLDHEAMGVRPKLLYCSKCCHCIAYPTNYCPNCGAKMEEGEQE